MWPSINASPGPGSMLNLSQTLFHSGSTLVFRFREGPEGAFSPIPGDKVAFQLKSGGQSSATQSLSAAVLDENLEATLQVPDVASSPESFSGALPPYAQGSDPFSPVPCRVALFRNVDGAWRLALASGRCLVEPVATSSAALPDPVPGQLYLSHGGKVYTLSLVDLEGEITTAVAEVEE